MYRRLDYYKTVSAYIYMFFVHTCGACGALEYQEIREGSQKILMKHVLYASNTNSMRDKHDNVLKNRS